MKSPKQPPIIPECLKVQGNVLRFLDKKKPATRAVVSPSALSTKLCEHSNTAYTAKSKELLEREAILQLNYPLRAMLLLLQDHGLRVSELLGISGGDIFKDGKVLIRGLKGSRNRIIHSGEIGAYMESCAGVHGRIWVEYSRFWLYRELKKMGVILAHEGKERHSVTHAFRHQYIAQANQIDGIETAQHSVGHRSSNSTKQYVNGQDKKGSNKGRNTKR